MINKKPVAKPVAKVTEPEAEEGGILNVSVSRKFTYAPTAGSQYESLSISAQVTATDYDTATATLDEIMMAEAEKANVQFAEVAMSANSVAADLEEADGTVDETAEAGAEDEDIGPDQINEMKREPLLELAKANGLPIKPADYAKNAKGLANLREDIIKIAFADDDAGDAPEETGDETGEEETGTEEETGDLTVEDVMAMERSELIALVKENSLGIATKNYPKIADLRTAVIEVAFAEEETGDETGEEETGTEEEVQAYDEAELAAMSIDELKLIYTSWEMGKFPAGIPKVAKAAAVKALMAAQNAA